MRIGFMGKGGSGKTTVATAFTKYLTEQKPTAPIFLFDVDLNAHVAQEFGVEIGKEQYFGGKFQEVASLLEPSLQEKLGMDEVPAFGTLLPSEATKFIQVGDGEHPFVQAYGVTQGQVTFFAVGNHLTRKGEGHSCYHDMLNAYELAIHRIVDTPETYVIADSTAGIDSLGTSLYMAYDLVVFVVEPTLRSVGVYQEYMSIPEVQRTKVLVIGNKVEDEEDKTFIEKHVGAERLLGCISYDIALYQGRDTDGYEHFVKEHEQELAAILQQLDSQEKNWKSYYQEVYRLFQKEASGWWSDFYKVPLEEKWEEDYGFLSQW